MADETTNIGVSITVSGELRSEEDVTVQGRIEGHIETSADLYIEEGGVVEAEIVTRNIEVRGKVVGNVTASQRFEIHEGGSVTGDVRAPSVILADGAQYKGRIDMEFALPSSAD